jgi:hypothetical protein
MPNYNYRKPWQAGLVAATVLGLVSIFAWQLNQAGHSQWAFMLLFGAAWCMIALCWANDGFIEESGIMLAEAVDQNIELLQRRLQALERELQELRSLLPDSAAGTFSPTRAPVARDQWV